jgi:hypothetical protein
MRIEPDRIPTALEVRAVYTVTELARAAGVSLHVMRQLLEDGGVTLLRAGRHVMVPLCDIETHIPPLWQSLVAAERLRADVRAGASAAARRNRPAV